jgi:glutamate formiminotransferase
LHQGTHPTLGVVDNILFSPIGKKSSLQECSAMAKQFSVSLHQKHNINVFCYGAASSNNQSLAAIRRSLGYFRNNTYNSNNITMQPLIPDFGSNSILHVNDSTEITEINAPNISFINSKGICCVGATNFILNFNIKFHQNSTKKDVQEVTKYVRNIDVILINFFYYSHNNIKNSIEKTY